MLFGLRIFSLRVFGFRVFGLRVLDFRIFILNPLGRSLVYSLLKPEQYY